MWRRRWQRCRRCESPTRKTPYLTATRRRPSSPPSRMRSSHPTIPSPPSGPLLHREEDAIGSTVTWSNPRPGDREGGRQESLGTCRFPPQNDRIDNVDGGDGSHDRDDQDVTTMDVAGGIIVEYSDCDSFAITAAITIGGAAPETRWRQILALAHVVEAHDSSRRRSSTNAAAEFFPSWLIGALSPSVVVHRRVLRSRIGRRWDVSPLPRLSSAAAAAAVISSCPPPSSHLLCHRRPLMFIIASWLPPPSPLHRRRHLSSALACRRPPPSFPSIVRLHGGK